MKIIFCKWGSICEKGIANALQRLGITVITMNRKFESVDYDKGYLETLADLIQKIQMRRVYSLSISSQS